MDITKLFSNPTSSVRRHSCDWYYLCWSSNSVQRSAMLPGESKSIAEKKVVESEANTSVPTSNSDKVEDSVSLKGQMAVSTTG